MAKNVIIALILCVLVYGFFIEPNRLQVTKYKINDNSLKGVRIAFVSDFHIRPGDENKLRNVVKVINAQEPDVVLSAGGFLNGSLEKSMSPDKIAARLSLINKKSNFYTVLGDKDLQSGKSAIINAFAKCSNLKVIDNTHKRLLVKGRLFSVAGIEDSLSGKPEVKNVLNNAKAPIIVLTHSPDIFPQIPQNVTLTLTGHTHGGQANIPPLKSLIYKDKQIYGLIEEDGKKMIITSGIGTGVIPFRLNCPPEVVVIDFI